MEKGKKDFKKIVFLPPAWDQMSGTNRFVVTIQER